MNDFNIKLRWNYALEDDELHAAEWTKRGSADRVPVMGDRIVIMGPSSDPDYPIKAFPLPVELVTFTPHDEGERYSAEVELRKLTSPSSHK